MGEELKPCPFCGTDSLTVEPALFEWFRVECADDECAVEGPWAKSEDEAASKWNTRA